MERQYDPSWLEDYLNKHSPFDGTLIADQIRELQKYKDTGLTPEEIASNSIAFAEDRKFFFEQKKAIQNEVEQWKREALTYASQLGEIRICLNEFGCTPEKILEDCKAKSPSTTDAP